MRNDDVLLLDMMLAARNIQQFTADMQEQNFNAHLMAQSAVIREFQVIGEAARQISAETKAKYPAIAWHTIAGMRNRMIHEYFDIRLPVVWQTIRNDIPALIAQLEAIVPADTGDNPPEG